MRFKTPVSVLVIVHTVALDVLLLERKQRRGFWQSVTGSQEDNEPLNLTAQREVFEETGIQAPITQFIDWKKTNCFEIFPEWQYRYGPGVTHNTEHVFSLMLAEKCPIKISPAEHVDYQWLPWKEAAAACFSWSNRDAILMLGETAQY